MQIKLFVRLNIDKMEDDVNVFLGELNSNQVINVTVQNQSDCCLAEILYYK